MHAQRTRITQASCSFSSRLYLTGHSALFVNGESFPFVSSHEHNSTLPLIADSYVISPQLLQKLVASQGMQELLERLVAAGYLSAIAREDPEANESWRLNCTRN